MIPAKQSHRETQYRPLAAKTLRQALICFITREFPRLGGPWVIELFVDKALELVEAHRAAADCLRPGQTVWLAVAVDERPGYRKPMTHTRQVPVVITLVDQNDIANLRAGVKWTEVLKRALVRAAHEAYGQGGVLTCTDLSVLFHHSTSRIAELVREYEIGTGEVVPRRGNLHDIGRTVTHRRIICRKAYLEGKPTHLIAQETCHCPQAVDNYVLDLARVYFATVKRGMTPQEAAFATQRPLYLVEEYVKLIDEFDLQEQIVYDQTGVHMVMCSGATESSPASDSKQNERREQEPSAG